MNFFYKNKKQPKQDEFEVINSDNKVADSTPSIVNSIFNDEVEESVQKSVSRNADEDSCSDLDIYSNKLYEYSSSLMDSISFNMYSDSTRNEVKQSAYDALKNTWGKIKSAYNYVSNLNEEYVANELQNGTNTYINDKQYYNNVGLDVSI